jgi:predicted RNase H-like HicB family nuclease
VRKGNPVFASWCAELDIASQGKTIEQSIANLKEAIELYLEDEDAYVPEELYEEECSEGPMIVSLNIKA